MHDLEHVYQVSDFFIYKIRGIIFVLKKSTHRDIHTHNAVKENSLEG